jgi:hypothetical protein
MLLLYPVELQAPMTKSNEKSITGCLRRKDHSALEFRRLISNIVRVWTV